MTENDRRMETWNDFLTSNANDQRYNVWAMSIAFSIVLLTMHVEQPVIWIGSAIDDAAATAVQLKMSVGRTNFVMNVDENESVNVYLFDDVLNRATLIGFALMDGVDRMMTMTVLKV